MAAAAIPALIQAAPAIGSTLAGIFGGGGGGGKKLRKSVNKQLQAWIKAGGLQRLLADMQAQRQAQLRSFGQLEQFAGRFIPRTFGDLSEAAQAQRDQELQAALSGTATARVGGLGQLQQKFGGRAPASVMSSFLGQLGRGETEQRTGIQRRAVERNVELGQYGAGLLGQVAGMRGGPSPELTGFGSLSSIGLGGPSGGSAGWGAFGGAMRESGPLFERLAAWLRKRGAAPAGGTTYSGTTAMPSYGGYGGGFGGLTT